MTASHTHAADGSDDGASNNQDDESEDEFVSVHALASLCDTRGRAPVKGKKQSTRHHRRADSDDENDAPPVRFVPYASSVLKTTKFGLYYADSCRH